MTNNQGDVNLSVSEEPKNGQAESGGREIALPPARRVSPTRNPATGLTEQQTRFVHEYLKDLNATGAYLRAGYADHPQRGIVHVNATALLSSQAVQRAVRERLDLVLARIGIQAETVLREYARVAFSDVRSITTVDETGIEVLPSSEWSDDAAAAVQSVEARKTKDGTVVRVKMHDKLQALNKLAQYLKLLTPAEASDTDDLLPGQRRSDTNITLQNVQITVKYDYSDARSLTIQQTPSGVPARELQAADLERLLPPPGPLGPPLGSGSGSGSDV